MTIVPSSPSWGGRRGDRFGVNEMTDQSIGPVRPFKVEVSEETLEDLQLRLSLERGIAFPLADPRLGLEPSILRRIVEHWRERFDWRRVERELNGFEHVLVEVDGMDVHAVRVRGEGSSPLPLIISHGWPSSFAEILPAVNLLTRPGDFGGDPADAFDVVVASLPGYPFSGPPLQLSDAGAAAIARRFHGLMLALGYRRYGASGGDIAARVVAWMGANEPQALAGLHMSCNAIVPPDPAVDIEEREWLDREQDWWDDGGGYEHIQRTRPRTIAVALNESPLAAAGVDHRKVVRVGAGCVGSDCPLRRGCPAYSRDVALVRRDRRELGPYLHGICAAAGPASAARIGDCSSRLLRL